MQTEVTIAALNKQLDGAKEAQKKLERLERLCKNRDFKELILDDYCIQECARLVHMSISPGQDAESRAKFLAMGQATGGVLHYLRAQENLLGTAVASIPDLEVQLQDLRALPAGYDEDSE